MTTLPAMDGELKRLRLAEAKLLLIFTPDLAASDPMAALEAAMPFVDIVQVRPKPLGDRSSDAAAQATITEARLAFEWCERVLDQRERLRLAAPPLVMVNDRVDVAIALAGRGLDGVHVGTDDMPPALAREVLGEELLLGLSSHTTADLTRAWDQPIDLLGFGPIFPTSTKGYGAEATQVPPHAPRIVGPELAWIASEMAPVPVFPIGGIDVANVFELERVGRAAVGGAILGAADPGAAARHMRDTLGAC